MGKMLHNAGRKAAIEMLWSKVKALLRKWECRTAELLPKTVSCALLCVSQRDCAGWFKVDGYCL